MKERHFSGTEFELKLISLLILLVMHVRIDRFSTLYLINEATVTDNLMCPNHFRYQCDDRYPEDKDICDISPNAVAMDIKSRRYQFWLQCEQLERFSTLLEAYVTGEDDMRLPEVDQCFNESRSSSGEQELETFLKKRTDVENTKSFISDLKSKMYDEITTDFERYKKNIEEQLKKK